MRNFLLLLFMLIAAANIAKGHTVEVDKLYVETEKMVRTNRGYYLPPSSVPMFNMNLGLNLTDISGIVYCNNKISTTTDQSQFRYGALDVEVGLNTTIGQIYYRHYSGHMFDAASVGRFPEENVIGLRFNLLEE